MKSCKLLNVNSKCKYAHLWLTTGQGVCVGTCKRKDMCAFLSKSVFIECCE